MAIKILEELLPKVFRIIPDMAKDSNGSEVVEVRYIDSVLPNIPDKITTASDQ
jgi:hypothetical protein